ncbi:LytTR family DNA-binding domain-containing protein [Aquabacterium sp. OR-4]|nr:LytTR family DNA-binding domain-containing protein [Aquabacterium sp. OR-4]MDT7835776.1 LytTR family DNA-binding domain-containing protein [Aquabacterium sp. OR-4]
MAALRVLIVDDEPLARMRLMTLLRQLSAEAAAADPGPPGTQPLPRCEVVGEAGDADAALARLADTPCDLVLLDIALPGRDGLRTAAALRALGQPPQVVFVTAHAEHALAAFDLDATDYLTKPVRRDRLQAALLRAARRLPPATALAALPEAPVPSLATATATATGEPGLAAQPADAEVLSFSHRGRVQRIPLAEVLSLKAELKYVKLTSSTQGRWMLDESLAELEPRLGPGFLRVHRNAIVARAAVRALERAADSAPSADVEGGENWVVRLSDGQTLAVSRRQVAAVREALR